jgi:two-component system response regulator BaeR
LLDLTSTEFRLLSGLISAPGRVFTRDRLLECLHGDGRALTDRTVDSHIKNIRRKLEQIAPGRELIVSVYGAGYKVDI